MSNEINRSVIRVVKEYVVETYGDSMDVEHVVREVIDVEEGTQYVAESNDKSLVNDVYAVLESAEYEVVEEHIVDMDNDDKPETLIEERASFLNRGWRGDFVLYTNDKIKLIRPLNR